MAMSLNEDLLFDFISDVFGEGRTKESMRVVMIGDVNGHSGEKIISTRDGDAIATHVERWGARGFDAFMPLVTYTTGATTAEAKIEEVAGISTVVDSQERVKNLLSLELPPNYVLKSGKEFIAVWRVNPIKGAKGERLEGLLDAMGSPVDALIPLPGTDGVETIHSAPARSYGLGELFSFFADEDVEQEEPAAVVAPVVEEVSLGEPVKEEPLLYGTIPETWSGMFAMGASKDARPGSWQPRKMDLKGLITGFTTHTEGSKDGISILQGSNFEGARQANSMDTLFIIGVDVDDGTPSEVIDQKIKDKGLFCIRYTTHSHGKNYTDVKQTDFVKFQKTNPGACAKEYLTAKKGYLPHVVEDATIGETVGRKDGLFVRLHHKQMDKNRLIFILKQPWSVTSYPDQKIAIESWGSAYTAFCSWMGLGGNFDKSCTDPSRLFFAPRYEKGKPHESVVHQGKSINIFALPTVAVGRAAIKTTSNAFLDAAADMGIKDRDPDMSNIMKALRRWAAQGYADRLMLTKLIEDHVPEKFRPEADKGDLHHLECPYEDEHSSHGGTGTYIVDAGLSTGGAVVVKCMHGGCVDRDRLQFLEKMIAEGWFKFEDLTNDEYLLEIEEEEAVKPTAKPIRAKKADDTQEEEQDDMLSLEEIEAALKRLVKRDLPEMQATSEITKLSKQTKELTKTELLKQFMKLKKQHKSAETKMNTEAKSDRKVFYCGADFREAADKTMEALVAVNDPPMIFKFDNHISRVIRTDDEQVAIDPLTLQTLTHEVSHITKWLRPLGEEVIEVAPPREIVEDLMAVPPNKVKFPVLDGVVGTPVFTKSGKLHATPGYDPESRTFYQPVDGFELKPISDVPSKEEVVRAKSLLLDDVLVDFPFDGQAERAHAVAMIMLPFVRNMVDGPTPMHWIDKPSPGTGASKLVNCVSLLAIGAQADPVTEETRDDEMKKKLTSVLKTGTPVFFMDNVNARMDSGAFATALTAPRWKDRALGSNATVNIPIRCVFIVAGNNIEMSSELLRRALRIRLDSKMERPAMRTGFRHKDLEAWIVANRSELVWACLTLAQHWIATGAKRYSARSLGSFENWTQTLGGILEAAGIEGFLDNLDVVQESMDEETRVLKTFLSLWWERFGSTPTTVKGTNEYSEDGLFSLLEMAELPIHATNDDMKKTRLGKYIGKYKGRHFSIDTDQGTKTVTLMEAGAHSRTRTLQWQLKPKDGTEG